jgi:hypothetical protein
MISGIPKGNHENGNARLRKLRAQSKEAATRVIDQFIAFHDVMVWEGGKCRTSIYAQALKCAT